MRQLMILEPGRVQLREAPIPRAGKGEIVLKIRAALTCGTDLKTFRRGHPKFKLPMPFGHEYSGDVYEAGEGVTDFKPGDPVMLAPTAPCGKCSLCKRGLGNLCSYTMETMNHGGYAQFIKIPEHIVRTNVFSKTENLDYFEAAALEPLSTVVHGASFINIDPGVSNVLIIGAGPIGLMYIPVMRLKGAKIIAVIGRRALRLECARQMGADCVIDEKNTSPQKIQSILRNVFGPQGCQAVIECTGQTATWESSFKMAADGGQVMLFGGCAGGTSFSIDAAEITKRKLSIKGAFHFTPEAVREARALLCAGEISVAPIITHKIGLTQYDKMIEMMLAGESIKIGVDPDL